MAQFHVLRGTKIDNEIPENFQVEYAFKFEDSCQRSRYHIPEVSSQAINRGIDH